MEWWWKGNAGGKLKYLYKNRYKKFSLLERNRMMERNSHLAGLWIGAAISNTSHSNKAGATTVKRARLTGRIKVEGSVATISIKNFPISLHVMFLYFPEMPHTRKIGIILVQHKTNVIKQGGYGMATIWQALGIQRGPVQMRKRMNMVRCAGHTKLLQDGMKGRKI
jgi:hypothetical protein